MKKAPLIILFCLLSLANSVGIHAEQIVIWHQKETASAKLKTMLKPVEQKYGVTFTLTYISTNDLKSALITSALNNRQPNMALIPSDFFGEFKSFRPREIPSSLVDSLAIDKQAWSLSRVHGKVYGVPLFIGNHMLLYYNKKMVAEPARDWAQLDSQRLTLAPGKKLIGWNYGELFWFIHVISAFNAFPVSDGKVTLNSSELAKALYFYRNLSRTGFISSSCDYACGSQRFIDGEFAYSLNGDWAYADMKHHMGDNLGIATLPEIEGSPMKSYFSAVTLVYLGQNNNQDLSEVEIAVLRTLMEEENQVTMFNQMGLIPADRKNRDKLNLEENPDYKTITSVLESAIPLPSSPAMSAAWAGMRKGFDYFHASDVTSNRAAELMQKVADRELKRLQGEQ